MRFESDDRGITKELIPPLRGSPESRIGVVQFVQSQPQDVGLSDSDTHSLKDARSTLRRPTFGIAGIEARDFGFEIPSAAGSQEVPNFSTQSMDNRRTITGTATRSMSTTEDKNKRQ